jgi:putative transposase
MIKSLNTIKTEAFPMNQFNKEIFDALSSDSKTSLKDVFRNQLEQTVNTLLQEELSAVLGYQLYERNDSSAHGDNARNGSYQRTIDTEFGPINITVPRDHKNKFRNALFEPYSRRTDTLESMIIKMYSKGITTREIADLVERMYGDYYSPTTVSNITKQVGNLVEEFHDRNLKHSQYVCVFLDATYIPLKRGTVEREVVNIAIGIRSDGGKEVLDFSVAPNENGEAWRELMVKHGVNYLKVYAIEELNRFSYSSPMVLLGSKM